MTSNSNSHYKKELSTFLENIKGQNPYNTLARGLIVIVGDTSCGADFAM